MIKMVLFQDLTSRRAKRAKEDKEYRETFIADNRTFILKAASKAIHHYVSEHDDEWSVALIAFNEAIDKYTPEKGSFSSYVGMVIQNRITDKLRSDYRFQSEIPAELEDIDKNTEVIDPLSVEIKKKIEEESLRKQSSPGNEAREEIKEVQKLLHQYGFSFYDLTSCSPKAEKTKKECALAVMALLENDTLFAKMRKTRTLPAEEIIQASGVKKKILERHRKYIIAAAEILHGEYPLLAGYMNYIRKQMYL